ncbi:MAG: lipoprotein [Rhodospirillales bacterium]|nr:lipoprotein [Rhodospirillales bacterium]MDE0712104.1 lipoprotein [Rhodospirillales bacterium]
MTWLSAVFGIALLLLSGCGRAGDLVRPQGSEHDPAPPGLETDPPYQF